MKKRIFALFLVLTLAVSLSACGNAVTPEAAVGEILENGYRNEAFGFAIELADGWQVATDEERAALIGQASEQASGTDTAKLFEAADTVCTFYAYDPATGNNMNIMLQKANEVAVFMTSPSAYIKSYLTSTEKAFSDLGATDIRVAQSDIELSEKVLGAVDASCKLYDIQLNEKLISFKSGSYICTVTLAGINASANDLLPMLSVIEG